VQVSRAFYPISIYLESTSDDLKRSNLGTCTASPIQVLCCFRRLPFAEVHGRSLFARKIASRNVLEHQVNGWEVDGSVING
jgi:hypothetical protein